MLALTILLYVAKLLFSSLSSLSRVVCPLWRISAYIKCFVLLSDGFMHGHRGYVSSLPAPTGPHQFSGIISQTDFLMSAPGCPSVVKRHGKSLNLVRPFYTPGKSLKITQDMEGRGKGLQKS